MKYSKTLGIGILAAGAIASAAAADLGYNLAQPRRQDDTNNYLGVTGSIYFPTQQRMKDAFNNQILYYGITVAQNNLDYNWKVRPDIGFFAATNDSNRLFIVPVEAAISRKFAQPGSGFQPYAKLGAGLAYFNYHIEEAGGTTSGSRIGEVATGEVGIILSQRIRLFGSYNWFSKESGFDFSGFQIGATISFFKL